MRKELFEVSADEKLYYLTTEIRAFGKEEAKEKYLEMIEKGKIDVNKSEILNVRVKRLEV